MILNSGVEVYLSYYVMLMGGSNMWIMSPFLNSAVR